MDLVLFGVGAALIVDYEETCRRRDITIVAAIRNRDGKVFFSDPSRLQTPETLDAALLGIPCLCPIYATDARRIAHEEATALGFTPAPTLIDPTSPVASTAQLGPGGYVNAGCVIAGMVRIGAHVVINRGTTIGHHAHIEDFVSIGPSAVLLGHTSIETGAMIGAGAIILPRLRVGAHAVVGAGAVVTRDVPANTRVLGSPARPTL